jgi:putative iron-dependent peroxidase
VTWQPAILTPVPPAARYVVVDVPPAASAKDLAQRLGELVIDERLVVGLGEPLVRALGAAVAGLHTFPAMAGPGCAVPSTQGALLLHARGEDHGETLHAMQHVLAALGGDLRITEDIAGFRHLEGRDLSGYEDGTENPTGDAAIAAAFTDEGASFVAVQRWIHDLGGFERMSARERDHVIGRNRETNAELADAPASAHVKRSAQESFDPPAFMVRRSMPYGTVTEHGLYFVAYARSLDRFERVMRRMVGGDDGIVDGLFRFSRPVSGGHYWCPPVRGKHLDLRAVA